MNHQPNTPSSINEAVATINGEPATAHSLLAALIDIHDDEQKNAPEDRCYVESAWGDCMRIARAFLASAITPEPSLKERADALMAAGHAFWQACRRDAGDGAVRWLKATDGTTIIFTRGEYARTLLSAIGTDYQAPEIVFEQPVGDDDMGGIVASIAAPGAAIGAREQEPPETISAKVDRVNLQVMRRFTSMWHADAVRLGYDGVCSLLESLLASRQEAPAASGETGDKPRGPRIEHLCRAICAHIGVDPDQVLDYTDGKPSKLAWHRHDLQAARLLRELDALATPSEALFHATVAQPVALTDEHLDNLWHRAEQTGIGYMSSRLRAHEFARLLFAAQPCASQGCGGLVERLKQEAQIHAQEARTANSTIAEIYRIVTGGTGEPGNWNGAEPVRKCIEGLRTQVAALSPDKSAQ